MVVIEDAMCFKQFHPCRGPKYRPQGVNVPPPPLLGYLHVLRDILAPLTRVIVVLPLIFSITTVHESPRVALLDSRAAFLRTPHFSSFYTLIIGFECKKRENRGVSMKAVRDEGKEPRG